MSYFIKLGSYAPPQDNIDYPRRMRVLFSLPRASLLCLSLYICLSFDSFLTVTPHSTLFYLFKQKGPVECVTCERRLGPEVYTFLT